MIVERLLAGHVSPDNIGEKNVQLGRLEVINYMLSEDLFDDLKESMEVQHGTTD